MSQILKLLYLYTGQPKNMDTFFFTQVEFSQLKLTDSNVNNRLSLLYYHFKLIKTKMFS